MAAAGDLIISAPMTGEDLPGLGRTWALLKSADVAVANMETPPVDRSQVKIFPNGEALLQGPPSLAADARAMGFTLMSVANNHATDLGPDATVNTRGLLAAAGIAAAGSGATLEEARAPAYADTPRAKVALVAVASTFKPNSMAEDAQPDWPARAGVSALHVNKISLVGEAELAALKAIATRQSYGRYLPPAKAAMQVTLNGATYRLTATPGATWEMNPYDHYAVIKAIHDARAKAGVVIFSIHAHETDTGIDDDNPTPADFLVRLLHEAVDAGADVVVGGGPHANRGVEIYKGKPIFYGMGVFTMSGKAYFSQEAQMDRPATMPAAGSARAQLGVPIGHPRSWLESMVAVSDFEDGRLARVRIYPLDLRGDPGSARRGRPVLAEGAEAARMLQLLQRDSDQFGTRIEIQGSMGIIQVGQTSGARQ